MNRDDLALIEAARAQDVNLHKNDDGNWEVGLSVSMEPVPPGMARRADAFLSGDRIRLADGREFKRVMTPDEARRTFGLDPGV
jgi:hypothetical protein